MSASSARRALFAAVLSFALPALAGAAPALVTTRIDGTTLHLPAPAGLVAMPEAVTTAQQRMKGTPFEGTQIHAIFALPAGRTRFLAGDPTALLFDQAMLSSASGPAAIAPAQIAKFADDLAVHPPVVSSSEPGSEAVVQRVRQMLAADASGMQDRVLPAAGKGAVSVARFAIGHAAIGTIQYAAYPDGHATYLRSYGAVVLHGHAVNAMFIRSQPATTTSVRRMERSLRLWLQALLDANGGGAAPR